MRTTSGHSLEILFPGYRNSHAGPDFLGARIRIGTLLWVGNVEIHTRSGEWIRHGHHLDPAYNSVILHVVHIYEGEILNASGRQVQTMVLEFQEPHVTPLAALIPGEKTGPCPAFAGKRVQSFPWDWVRELGRMRMDQKAATTRALLNSRSLSREEVLYRMLACGFGIPVNTFPFGWLASRIPVTLLREYRDSLTELEAILFGQAGFLEPGNLEGPYLRSLGKSYRTLRKRMIQGTIGSHLWKYLRLRPAAFPTVRMAQFAALLHHCLPFTETLLTDASLTELEQRFRVKASDFWDTHYVFRKPSPPSPKYVGDTAIRMLIINAVIPFLQAWGETEKRKDLTGRAHALLLEVEAETNHITKKWINFGSSPKNALESQGMIQLHHQFCVKKKCAGCEIWKLLLGESADEKP